MKLYDALSNRRWRQDGPYDGTRRIESRALADELAALYRRQDTAMGRWAEGYGRIRHSGLTQLQPAWNGGSARGARPPGLAATGLVIGRGALLRWHFYWATLSWHAFVGPWLYKAAHQLTRRV